MDGGHSRKGVSAILEGCILPFKKNNLPCLSVDYQYSSLYCLADFYDGNSHYHTSRKAFLRPF